MPIVDDQGQEIEYRPVGQIVDDGPEGPSLARRAASMVPRIGLPIAGGILGAMSPVPGGTYGGAAIGGGIGEAIGQAVEGTPLNPATVGVEAVLSALPGGWFGKGASIAGTAARRAGEGAVMGAAGYVPRALARGEDPTLQGAAIDTAFGGIVGAGAGGIEGSFTRGGADVGFTSPAQRAARRVLGRGETPDAPVAPMPGAGPEVAPVGQIVDEAPIPEGRPRGTVQRWDAEGNPIVGDAQPSGNPGELPARNPLNPTASDAIARKVQGLADDAPNVPPITPQDIERYQRIQSRPIGNEIQVRSAANPNQPYKMRWRLLSLDDLEVNDARVQPRERGDRKASDSQVALIAADPRADEVMAGNDLLYAGTPIIGPDGLPEGGNGRASGFRMARADNPEGWARFQARQRELAQIAGFTPDQLDQIKDPILVRERITPVKDRLAFADETNARPQLAMSAAENARRDAAKLPDGVLEALSVGDSQTLDQALASGSNRQAVRGFLATLPANEAASLVDANGNLSQDGVRRMKAAILAKAFPGESGSRLVRSITESTDSGVKQAEAGIAGAMGKLAKVRPALSEYPEADIAEDLAWAVDKLAQIRSEGGSVDDYLRQATMFVADRTQRRDVLLGFIGKAKSAKKIREALGAYADNVGALPPKSQGSLLGGEAPAIDALPLLESAINRQGSLIASESGGIEPPRILRRILEYIADEDNKRTPQAPITDAPPDQGPIPKSRRQTLGQMGLTEAGNSPAPPAAVDILDANGNPIPRSGALSSDDPARLAPSLLDDVRDADSLYNFKNRIAQAKSADVEYARRGIRSQDETLRSARGIAAELADRLDEDVDDFLRVRDRGQNLNAEQLTALLSTSDELLSRFTTAASRASRTGDPGDVADAFRILQIYKGTMLQEAGAVAEAGRALNILNAAKQARGENEKAIRLALQQAGASEEGLREVFDQFLKMGDDPVGRARFMKVAAGGETRWDKLIKFRLAFMLSNPKTHIVNMMGNTGALSLRIPQRAIAGGIDAARVAAFGGERDRFASEALADLYGMTGPVRAGVRAAKQAINEAKVDERAAQILGGTQGLKQGVRAFLRELTSSPVESTASKFDVRTGDKSGILLSPLRLLQAEDEIFKAAGYYGDLYARAYRQAAKEGLKGNERINRTAEILAKPEREMVEAAKLESLYRTFQGESGEFTKNLLRLRGTKIPKTDIKPGELIIPFVKTPVKLAGFAAEHSPAKAISLIYNAGEMGAGEFADEAAKLAIGSALAGAVAMYAADGLITGSGPADPEQQRAWRNLGNQPYSIYLGERIGWVSYQRLDPIAIVIGATADAVEATDAEPEDMAAKLAFAFANNVTNKTYMQGLSDAIEAINDPDRNASRFLQTLATSAIPAVVGQAARTLDPTVRRPGSMREALANRIPGMRGDVPPIRNVWGEPIIEEGGAVERTLSPFARTVPKNDPATLELSRLGVSPGSPSKELGIGVRGFSGTVKWTPEDYERYSFASGQLAKQLVTALIQTPQYQGIDDAQKAKQIEMQFRYAREFVRDAMRPGALQNSAKAGLFGKNAVLPSMRPIIPPIGGGSGLPRLPSP